MGPEDNPRDDKQDDETLFLFTIAEMIQEGEISKARVHLRAYIEYVRSSEILEGLREG